MEQERQEYKGHRIELRSREAAAFGADETRVESTPELLIDSTPIEYGQFPDGTYFLHEYAYDWTDNLMELARRFVDYRIEADERLREPQSNGGE
jgi:hypothetical protein